MAIQAIIPAGQTEVTVNGLHQWDYGQILEVHDLSLPAVVEIHFACPRMDEAVVRPCTTIKGVASAVIPDHCLEQNAPVVAWVYGIDGTTGQTLRTIVMPVIRRTKPAPAAMMPTYFSDKYTELMTAVTEQVDALRAGDVTVSNAIKAEQATVATTSTEAVHALRADNASAADYAGQAGSATKATRADSLTPATSHPGAISERITSPGVYAVVFDTSGEGVPGGYISDIICIPNLSKSTSSAFANYTPKSSGDSGTLMSNFDEALSGYYTIRALTKLASYPEG